MYSTFLCIFHFYVFMLEMYINREYRTEANTHLSQKNQFSRRFCVNHSFNLGHTAAAVHTVMTFNAIRALDMFDVWWCSHSVYSYIRTTLNNNLTNLYLYMFSLPSLITQHVAAGVCGKSAPTRSHSNFVMEDAVWQKPKAKQNKCINQAHLINLHHKKKKIKIQNHLKNVAGEGSTLGLGLKY